MDRLEELKSKYQSVLRLIEQKGLRMHNLHVEDNKLFIKASAGTQALKNEIWNQIKLVDPGFGDLTCYIGSTVSAGVLLPALRFENKTNHGADQLV